MSNPNTSLFAPQPWRRLALLALLGYGVFLAVHFTPVAGSADASGYLNLARMLGEGRLTQPMRVPPELEGVEWQHFTPLGFIAKTAESRELVPTYPPGLPLHLLVGAWVAGWEHGPMLVGVLGALAAIVLVYFCARELEIPPPLAAGCAVSLAVSTIFLFSAVQPMSDALSTAWCAGAVWTALRARRGGVGWAVACGTAFAIAVWVRPNNVLLGPALALLLFGRWRASLAAGLAGLPWAVLLLVYQQHLYGDPLRTGYGSIWGIFGPEHVRPTLAFYAEWIPAMLPGSVVAMLVAWALPWRQRAREIAVLVVWFAAFAGFYAFYLVTREAWWCVRFLLPALPALLLLAALGLGGVLARLGRRGSAWSTAGAATLLAGVSLVFSLRWTNHFGFSGVPESDRPYVEGAAWLREHAPANAVLVGMQVSGSYYYYTDFPVMRWDGVKQPEFDRFAARLRAEGRPVYAALMPFEIERAFGQHVADRWEKVAQIGHLGIWRLAP
jgi:hypothetical protein